MVMYLFTVTFIVQALEYCSNASNARPTIFHSSLKNLVVFYCQSIKWMHFCVPCSLQCKQVSSRMN